MLEVVLLASVFAAKTADLPPGAVLRLGDARWRAGGSIGRLWFTDDGRTLSARTARSDGGSPVVAWDAASGSRVAAGDLAPDGDVRTVRLKDGRTLAIGSDGMAEVRDGGGRRVASLAGHAAAVTAVAASGDGTRLATGDAAGLVRVWDASTLRPRTEPRGHTAPVTSIRVSEDAKRAVTSGPDGTARVWNLGTGKELAVFAADGPADFTPDSLGVVLRAGGGVEVRDVLTGLVVVPANRPPAPGPSAPGPAVSPNGRVSAFSLPGRAVELREAATGRPRRRLAGHGTACYAVAFTPDGTRLLTAGADHTVLVWDVRPQSMPLPEAVRRETSAAKLWATMCVGKADAAYLAMARLAAEPAAAVGTARLRLRPADAQTPDHPEQRLADVRAVELLEALGTAEAREFLKELAAGEATAFRTREAKRALERLK